MNRQELLDTAAKITKGDREKNYGSPEDNFGRIAELWSTYLGWDVSASDVAAMMVLMKVARIAHDPKHIDSWVDIAGYAACGGEING